MIAYYLRSVVVDGKESDLDEMTGNLIIVDAVDERHCWESVDHGMDHVDLLEVDNSASSSSN